MARLDRLRIHSLELSLGLRAPMMYSALDHTITRTLPVFTRMLPKVLRS
jgi:hypothetical protein